MPTAIAVVAASHTGKSSLAEPILGQMEFYGYNPIFIDDYRPFFYRKDEKIISLQDLLKIVENQILFEKQRKSNATGVTIISYPAICAYAWAKTRFFNATQKNITELELLGEEALALASEYAYFLYIKPTLRYLAWKQKKLKGKNSDFQLDVKVILQEDKILSDIIKEKGINHSKGYFVVSDNNDIDHYPNRRFARAIEILKKEFVRLGPMSREDIGKIAPLVAEKMKSPKENTPSFAELFGIE